MLNRCMRFSTGQPVLREIDLIRPLWEQLNEYHHAKASRFRDHYEQMTFEDTEIPFLQTP